MWASALMLVLGAALATLAVMHVLRRRSTPAPPPGPSLPGPQVAAEIEALTRRLADELDTRADRLERLIADADQRLKKLERLTAGAAVIGPGEAGVMAEVKHFDAAPDRPSRRPAAAVIAEIDPLANEVYKLADGGLPPVEIARTLGQHTGKVELILALRRA